ncbi:antibiotic biosynthesis monooxygenase [Stieleria sp. JC731]|uniref:antibiotic biosynthesis monooxygenase family protein n=1 Tax=Pirellulaceae TaxID=2691357 RepID=UPI001E2A7C89|nr:antibiotic biosynthesis monooxygenase [Stieleria sp. JC731]MCC9603584.1 antibiotic biosynthesis monooxygenase [Stieleria sp. JC731]
MRQESDIAPVRNEEHYAVIFSSIRNEDSGVDYNRAADRMLALAAQQDGFLGVESVREQDGTGITVSYWRDRDSIEAWHQVAEHQNVQELGRRLWYAEFAVRICRVERSYHFKKS